MSGKSALQLASGFSTTPELHAHLCVCVCVCVCAKGINPIMLKLRGSTILCSYHYCKP